ncbi:SelB C-terminal domain-containing protein [Conexibacter sp. W3-3-2]
MYGHSKALATVRHQALAILADEGEITVARLRDELGTSRKYALAHLEYLDAIRVTRCLPDYRRVVVRRSSRADGKPS